MSSAYNFTLTVPSNTSATSLINNKNSNGPRTLTALRHATIVTGAYGEDTLSTKTRWSLLDRNAVIISNSLLHYDTAQNCLIALSLVTKCSRMQHKHALQFIRLRR